MCVCVRVNLCVCVCVFTVSFLHNQGVTKGQFLSKIQLVCFQRFPCFRLVDSYENYFLVEKRMFVQNLNLKRRVCSLRVKLL